MENSENIINILILIAVGVISLISAINKKKKEQLQQEIPTTDQLPPVKEKKIKREKRTAPPLPNIRLQRTDSYQQIAMEPQEEELIAENATAWHDTVSLNDPEELRKAVIYSEILHRKYE